MISMPAYPLNLGSYEAGNAPPAFVAEPHHQSIPPPENEQPRTSIDSVANTLDLIDNKLLPANYQGPTFCGKPLQIARDPLTGELFVTCTESSAVLVVNATSGNVTDLITAGGGPFGIAYASRSNQFFVTNSLSNDVSVISAVNDSVVANISVGVFPSGIVYDPDNSDLYVSNYVSNTVSVIAAATDSVTATIPAGNWSTAIGFDPVNREVLLGGRDSMSYINTTSNTVVGGFNGGGAFAAFCYDGSTQQVYVTDSILNQVDVLNASTGQEIASISVGTDPTSIACDGADGTIYVANTADARWPQNNVSAISDRTDVVIAQLPVQGVPFGGYYDQVSGRVFFTIDYELGPQIFHGSEIDVVDPRTQAVINGIDLLVSPTSICVDSSSGDSYIASPGFPMGRVFVISHLSGEVVASIPLNLNMSSMFGSFGEMTYDVQNGDIYVSANSQVAVIDPKTNSVLTSIPISSPESMTYDSHSGNVYVGSSIPGELDVINGTTNRVETTIPVGHDIEGLDYASGIDQIYAADLSTNHLTVVSGETNRILANLTIGTQASGVLFDSVSYDSGTGTVYVADGPYVQRVNAVTDGMESPEAMPSGTDAETLAFNPTNGEVLVEGSTFPVVGQVQPGSITVLSGGNLLGTFPVGINPAGITYNSVTNTLMSVNEFSGTVSLILPSSSIPTLSSITVTPPTAILSTGGTENFSATPVCGNNGCPQGTLYSWTLNDTLGGSFAQSPSSTAEPVSFTAGNSAGSIEIVVNATLNGGTVMSSPIIVNITDSRIVRVTITPGAPYTTPGSNIQFTVTPVCSPSPCSSAWVTYRWTLNNSIGSLTAQGSAQTVFVAGGQPGRSLLRVVGNYLGLSVSNSTTILVKNNSNWAAPFGPSVIDGVIVGGLVAAVAVGFWVKRIRRHRQSDDTEESPEQRHPVG